MENQLMKICNDSFPLREKIETISMLTKVIQDVIQNSDVKYRQLKVADEPFGQRIWRHSAAQEFLALAGWVLEDGKIMLSSAEKLQEAHALLAKAKKYLEILQKSKKRDHYGEITKRLGLSEHDTKALEKYYPLLPKELEEACMRVFAVMDNGSGQGRFDEEEASVYASFAQKYHTALERLEQRDSLSLLRQKQTSDSELQRIEQKLTQLDVEEHELVCECEDYSIDILEKALSSFSERKHLSDEDVKMYGLLQEELKQRRLKKANRQAPPTFVSADKASALEFADYVSSLSATAQSYLEELIDWDHKGVDKHLTKIAEYMQDWETKLCTLLGLTDVDIHDLKVLNLKPKLLRKEVLKTWKEKEGLQATYAKLLKLCCKGGDARTAKRICEILNEMAEEIDTSKKNTPAQEEAMPVDSLSKKPRLLPLCKEMEVLNEQWREVGLFLDLSQEELDKVELEHSSTPSQCMKAILTKWFLRKDPPSTWKAIIEVVEYLKHEDVVHALKQAAAE